MLGVSNISFGLPARPVVNHAFLLAALYAGLDLPILNPNVAENRQAVAAFNVLTGRDTNCAAFTQMFAAAPEPAQKNAPLSDGKAERDIFYCIEKGLPRARAATAELLKEREPLAVINEFLIPALNKVGDLFESGKLFLPQLIAAAESAKGCFEEVKLHFKGGESANRGTIVLATVQGDVHDIGKNIVKTVLENYGYAILDLGKNVPCELVAETCRKQNVRLCGLSALMTTTVPNMEETIRLLRAACPRCKVMVGGAVLSEEYAKKIGADFYAKDANASVKIAEEVFGK